MNQKPIIGIFGEFQNGKSTMINCLLDGRYARTGGVGENVTSVSTSYYWGDVTKVEYNDEIGNGIEKSINQYLDEDFEEKKAYINIYLWKPLLKHVILLDTPGFNAYENDNRTAIQAMEKVDIGVIVLKNHGLSEQEKKLITYLHVNGIPFYIIMNCMDLHGNLKIWNPNDSFNEAKSKEIVDYLEEQGIETIKIDKRIVYCTNLIWFWIGSGNGTNDANMVDFNRKLSIYNRQFLKTDVINPRYYIENSGFLSIREALINDVIWGFPIMGLRYKRCLLSTISSWERKIKKYKI